MSTLTVLETGTLTLLQDRGRPGLAGQGVGASGAADRRSHDLANRLVGNGAGAATIEFVLGGLSMRADQDLVVAVTGAPAPARLGEVAVGHNAVLAMRAGSVLTLATPSIGLRSYIAVRGGFDVDPVLGSRATDVLSGLGPPTLAPGTVLPIGPTSGALPALDQAPVWSPAGGPVVLRACRGPRADRVRDDPFGRAWTASSRSDRIGIRLDGEPLRPAENLAELPSEGVVRGALQIPLPVSPSCSSLTIPSPVGIRLSPSYCPPTSISPHRSAPDNRSSFENPDTVGDRVRGTPMWSVYASHHYFGSRQTLRYGRAPGVGVVAT